MRTTTTYRQKDGSWQIIVSWKDANGKWRQKSKQGFVKKSDAKEAEAELIAQIKKAPRPVEHHLEGITLEDFCELYTKVKRSITENTKTNYKYAVKSLRIVAKRPVHMITYADLVNAISGWNMTPQTQKQYFSKLRILFRAAIKPYGLRSDDPTVDIELPKVRQKTERRTVTEEQLTVLLQHPRQDVVLAIAIGYYAGLRRGEILALQWTDVDWSAPAITVERQLDSRDGTIHSPKSRNGYRTIPIPQALVTMLKEYHNSRPLDINRRVFPHPHSTYFYMQRAIRRLDPALSPHRLRHTYATTLLARGIDIRTVAALLGDDVKTVIGTYIHYSDDMRQAAAQDIQKIFEKNFCRNLLTK